LDLRRRGWTSRIRFRHDCPVFKGQGMGKRAQSSQGQVRVGIGGWTYEPWRNNFYPEKLAHSRELDYASRKLSAIEINATYHGTQKPSSFAKWRDETPDGFVFSVKASRFATNRKLLADGRDSVMRFIDSGIAQLGAKLGPIVWQFMPTKRFEAEDFEAFLNLLPKEVDGLRLRHVLDVRHETFKTPDYLQLARRHGCATVFADSDDYPSFADLTADFVYARLMRTLSEVPTGYASASLDQWAQRARVWAGGGEPTDLPRVEPATPGAPSAAAAAARATKAPTAPSAPRDVFLFFISGAKERAPAAAMELIKRLG
jgi:uncharacterized protein YecE (DUF72 family)